MRNVVILGCGRSGTSMVAGTLAKAGYYMGNRLVPARESNPRGFFEDLEINNEINEVLLARVVPRRVRFLGREFFRHLPLHGQRWLAAVAVGTRISAPPHLVERIKEFTKREPFCFKDPRFSYTLPVWRPFLRNTVFVCVFRDPATTTLSILKECETQEYLHNLVIDWRRALRVWELMYGHILEVHVHEGEWLFLHYNQVVCEDGLEKLEAFTGASVDRHFPDASLRRSFSKDGVPRGCKEVYDRLCELAGYRD